MSDAQPDLRTVQPTQDGSMTLHSARFDQTYHSRHGALTESLHVFLEAGWHHTLNGLSSADTIRVLELGLGTGLNALLTLKAWRALAEDQRPEMEYVALEPYPLLSEEFDELEMEQVLGAAAAMELQAHPERNEHTVSWGANASFTRLKCTWQEFRRHTSQAPFDVIYYDAFSPDTQPELWNVDRFREAFKWLNPGGILVTYCAKGIVRRAMEEAGFQVERRPGPPGKREMLRATRPLWENMTLRRFNVRVYFFLLDRPLIQNRPDPGSQVLLSDEFLSGQNCTKWPGGGLEFGEGPQDCARREAMEELGQAICLGPLVHVTGNFVRSAWRGEEQVLCHYYLATLADPPAFRLAVQPFDYPSPEVESFRWVPVGSLVAEELSFEVDRDALDALRSML